MNEVKGLLKRLDEEANYYPVDHKLGMVVPKGGSDCAKCKFLVKKFHCRNKGFQKWMKDNFPEVEDPSLLPAPPDEYCCDLFTTKK